MAHRYFLFVVLAAFVPALGFAQSFYPERLNDPAAIYVDTPAAGQDSTALLQQAIDKAADTTHQGIVFVPSGRYRLTRTLYVWPGIRVIGYGVARPVFMLPANTPGFAAAPAYMVVFAGGRTGEHRRGSAQPSQAAQPAPFPGSVPPQPGVVDANPGTFYSAMSNIDFEIGPGNPGAVGIRFHVAQHCFLTHINFHIGSGLAALEDIGNEAEDLHFIGGEFGILTGRPSPGWQFTLLDSTFEGQRTAAIREHEAGLALIHDTFRNVPSAIDIEARHIEELWLENSILENISGPAITISEETSRLTEINLRNVLCRATPVFARLRESGRTFAGDGNAYRITEFTQGLTFDDPLHPAGVITAHVEMTKHPADRIDERPAIPAIPSHTGWANAHDLGVKGDGVTDDTAALQQAVNTHRTIYLPSGRYKLTDTLRLRADSVLIGLHPSTTQLDLPDDSPGFSGAGEPKPLLFAPAGGNAIVTGIGLFTGGSNNLATAVMWSSGADSLLDDVRFLGGHGTNNPDGSRMDPYNSTHSGDPNPLYKWDAQYPSLWITNGGGGTFADIWTPDTFAQAGLHISNTSTPGHVYELSSEHHVRNEAVLRGVSNWEIVALQTEEERGESGNCLPLFIEDSHNVIVAEMHAYRVVSSFMPFEEAIRVAHWDNIRFRNLHIDSDSKVVFDHSVRDDDTGAFNHELELASLTLLPNRSARSIQAGCDATAAHPFGEQASMCIKRQDRADTQTAASAQPNLQRLATGFFNAASLTAAPDGTLYFLDPVKQGIYSFQPADNQLTLLSDHPINPANLLFDDAANMLIVSYEGKGTIYVTRPAEAGVSMKLLQPQPATTPVSPTATPVLPVDHWRFDNERRFDIGSTPRPWRYISPDDSVVLPAGDDFVQGQLYYGTKMADVLRAFALRRAPIGSTFYVSDEGQERTYAGTVQLDGSLKNVHIFADRGGESTAVGPDGRVYIAAGAVYVYSPDGKQIDTIETPERPTALLFAGPGSRTLYILTRHSLYATQPASQTR